MTLAYACLAMRPPFLKHYFVRPMKVLRDPPNGPPFYDLGIKAHNIVEKSGISHWSTFPGDFFDPTTNTAGQFPTKDQHDAAVLANTGNTQHDTMCPDD